MRTLVIGGTGFIGRHLLRGLDRPVVTTRDPERARPALPSARLERWDPAAGPVPAAALEGVDVVFNLAGEPIAEGRWTDERRRRIRDSRVVGTRHLVAGMAALRSPPRVLVSASAIGIYGDRGDEVLDETSRRGDGFLADVCAAWEHEAMEAERLGVRVVCARTGIVLAADGGALPRMLTPFRLGVGGRLGSGAQWMSWVHVDDVVGLLLHAARTDGIRGPMNVVAPAPVTNAAFTRALGEVLHRPTMVPVPTAALQVMFGEMASVLVGSQRVAPRVAERSEYRFAHPDLGDAFRAILEQPRIATGPAASA